MSKIFTSPAQSPWMIGLGAADFRDKNEMIRQHMRYMFVRTQQMFKWEGLPDTIPEYILEQMLQGNGSCIITEASDGLRAFTGGLGGEPDIYYRGTKYVVSNPALTASKTYVIDEDCVFCRNDHMIIGLMPLNRRYATLLAENELSMYVGEINTRFQFNFGCNTDAEKLAADDLIRSLEAGKLSAAASSAFLGGMSVQPGATASDRVMQSLIETEQFIKASWYNELGLDSNYNMKRESLTTTESQMNSDALLPLIDDMLECRKDICDKVNAKYGTSLTVDYSSSWKDNQEQINEMPTESEEEVKEDVNAD